MLDAAFWGIQRLFPAGCARELPAPVTKWGTVARKSRVAGTYHFYTDDFKFTSLIRNPLSAVTTGVEVCVEPNFTIDPEMPKALALERIYQKRRIAAAWQAFGIRIVVDLNVDAEGRHHDIALLGVPEGWRAYATRKHKCVPMDCIWREHDMAVTHAGTTDILFCVFGGGRKMRDECKRQNWRWIPEHRHVVAGIERPYGQGE